MRRNKSRIALSRVLRTVEGQPDEAKIADSDPLWIIVTKLDGIVGSANTDSGTLIVVRGRTGSQPVLRKQHHYQLNRNQAS